MKCNKLGEFSSQVDDRNENAVAIKTNAMLKWNKTRKKNIPPNLVALAALSLLKPLKL